MVNWQDRLNPKGGGAETHLHEVFGRLAARGHEVTLLVSGWPGAPARVQLDGMQVHRTGGRYTFSTAAPSYYRRQLAAKGFDLVVEDLNKVPLFTPLWYRGPLVLLVHHLFGATAFHEAGPLLAGATWLLERPLDLIYRGVPTEAVSQSTAQDLVRRGFHREDITVIENGVDLAGCTPGREEERFPEPTMLYLGRLKKYKGVDLILRALARLRDEGVPGRLIIGGKGDYAGPLARLRDELGLQDRVEMPGFVSEEEKRNLFRRTWVHVLTSPKEGWGISNLEAAACGTPTVASDSPGLRDSVVDGETGFLVPHGDVEALARRLRAVLEDPALRRRLGVGARAFAERFTWERAANATEAHLQRVLAGVA
ncbi:MAG TPA: glycosyltransferase family 4 protein [Longimicrobiales bacterium]